GTAVTAADTAVNLDRLTRLHNRLCQAASNAGGEIDAVFFCPHPPQAQCPCRPPRPGLLLDIGLRLQLRLDTVPYLTLAGGAGLLAGQAAGAHCLVLGSCTDTDMPGFDTLDNAVQFLLDESNTNH
ncbi:MAG TPA: hypothetical protein VK971_04540, partial [Thiohalobacter sp.]|nr:hypothetical protein [Thiohalobacter sp.]